MTYVVAVLSLFDFVNKIYVVLALSSEEAMIKALKEFNSKMVDGASSDLNDQDYMVEWYAGLEGKNVEEIISDCMNGEIAISEPVKLN